MRSDRRILIDWRFEGRCPCAGDLWRCDRLTDVIEYPLDRGWLGDKGDDPHLGPTVRAEKRKTFIDTSQLKDRLGLPVLGSVGLYLTARHKGRRLLQLTLFSMVFLMLIGLYFGAVLYKEPGSRLVAEFLSEREISI